MSRWPLTQYTNWIELNWKPAASQTKVEQTNPVSPKQRWQNKNPHLGKNINGQSDYRYSRKHRADIQEEISLSAYLSNLIDNLPPGKIVKCNRVIINDGNSYNPKTGICVQFQRKVWTFSPTASTFTQSETHIKLVTDGVYTADVVTSS